MEKNMNTRKLLVSVLMLVCVLFSACAPVATPPAPISVPSTVVPIVASDQSLTTFSSKIYKLHMSVSFGSDWHVIDDFTDLVTVAGTQKDWNAGFNIVTNAKLADPVSGAQIPFPVDFASWIKSNPDFKTDEPIEITVGGIKGLQIDATPMPPKQKDFLYMSGTKWNIIPSAEQWRFILLNDVNGERLLIFLIAPADQFKDAVQQSQSILDSVAFTTTTSDQALTTFSSKKFGMPMSISFGPEWHVAEDFEDEILLVGGTQADDGVELVLILVKDARIADPASTATMPWPDDFMAYLHSNEYLVVGEPMPATVGRVNGVQTDVSVKNIGQKRIFIGLKSTGWLYLDADQNWRFIMLDDVNGERLLIGTTEAPEGFSVATELAQKVIDSVVFSNSPALAPTTFSPKTFNLPITLSYGPEWRVAEEYSDVFTLSYKGHDAGVSFINLKNAKIADGIAFPDDFVTWIQSTDSLFQVVESKSVLVGGFKGIQINATYTCGNKKNWIMLSGTGWGCANGEPIGFIYLDDVYGERVLIQIIPSPDGKDYEFIVEESQKVLDTVVFSKP
jgi:hypothetical protein